MGERDERVEPETETALRLLKAEGIEPKSIHVLTTLEAASEWKDLKLPYEWIICYEDEISDIDAVKIKAQKKIKLLVSRHVVIINCTSATKPATIAYYELAQMHQTPLIYIYESKSKLKWLKSKETIAREIVPAKKYKIISGLLQL